METQSWQLTLPAASAASSGRGSPFHSLAAMWLALGIVLLLFAVVALLFYLRTSYVTHGGGIGQVPVLGGAVQIPLLILLGLWFLGRANPEFDFPLWFYPLVGIVLAVTIGWLIIQVGNLGRNRHASGN